MAGPVVTGCWVEVMSIGSPFYVVCSVGDVNMCSLLDSFNSIGDCCLFDMESLCVVLPCGWVCEEPPLLGWCRGRGVIVGVLDDGREDVGECSAEGACEGVGEVSWLSAIKIWA